MAKWKYPNSEKVAMTFIRELLAGIAPVAAVRPDPNVSDWKSTGFVQVYTIGGTPNTDIPKYQPVLTIDCWAVGRGGNPDWGTANQLAEVVRHKLQSSVADFFGGTLDMGADMKDARVLSAWLVTEPRRITGNADDFARFTMDLEIHWVDVEDER